MIAVLAAVALLVPQKLHVATSRGTTEVPLAVVRGEGALVPLAALAGAIGATMQLAEPWVSLSTGTGTYRFLIGTPVVQDGATFVELPASARRRNDSVFVPLAFVSEILASPTRRAWRWSAATAVLSESAPASAIDGRANRPSPSPNTTTAAQLPSGLRAGHHVTIDAGHGGTDPGNPGMFFPHGLREKDVTLKVSLLVRDELEKQGVRVTMTRTTDTLINLEQRAPKYCGIKCDLFASIHVNSLEQRPGFTNVHGFETYFLSESQSADAARISRLENEAARFDRPDDRGTASSGLDFMFKDLQNNEYLRESQRAASMIQRLLGEMRDPPTSTTGVKQANFAVLRTARRPSVLIEIGYATNREDAQLMTSAEGQRGLAHSIADAIVLYLRNYDRQTTDTSTRGDR